jgi:glycerol-3-phosphate acyltransferase PlsY
MIEFAVIAAVLVTAYLLGSIPTALIISIKIKGVDIRNVGDGNMGARNAVHEIGPKFGIMVALIDFCKGALAVFLAYILGLSLGWQICYLRP